MSTLKKRNQSIKLYFQKTKNSKLKSKWCIMVKNQQTLSKYVDLISKKIEKL